jgi:hypothetical protein
VSLLSMLSSQYHNFRRQWRLTMQRAPPRNVR